MAVDGYWDEVLSLKTDPWTCIKLQPPRQPSDAGEWSGALVGGPLWHGGVGKTTSHQAQPTDRWTGRFVEFAK